MIHSFQGSYTIPTNSNNASCVCYFTKNTTGYEQAMAILRSGSNKEKIAGVIVKDATYYFYNTDRIDIDFTHIADAYGNYNFPVRVVYDTMVAGDPVYINFNTNAVTDTMFLSMPTDIKFLTSSYTYIVLPIHGGVFVGNDGTVRNVGITDTLTINSLGGRYVFDNDDFFATFNVIPMKYGHSMRIYNGASAIATVYLDNLTCYTEQERIEGGGVLNNKVVTSGMQQYIIAVMKGLNLQTRLYYKTLFEIATSCSSFVSKQVNKSTHTPFPEGEQSYNILSIDCDTVTPSRGDIVLTII